MPDLRPLDRDDDGIGTLSSYMCETNGGGSPEPVPGFDVSRAVTAGFRSRRMGGPTYLAARPDGGYFSTPSGAGTFEAKPEAVIGADGRVRVEDTSLTPWRCIVQIEVEYDRGPVGFGTGFLVGPGAVVTAAHVLRPDAFKPNGYQRNARQVRVVPGRNGPIAPFDYFESGDFEFSHPWREPGDDAAELVASDYAAILLSEEEQATADQIGYFGLKVFPDDRVDQLEMLFVNNAGFPYEADKPYGTLWYNGGRIRSVDGPLIEYMVDTEGGQSGSPVYVYDRAKDARLVVGIHTTGDFVNRGVRITEAVSDEIRSWSGR